MGYYRRIRDLREDHDLTQRQLAAKLGIDGIWTPINGFCGIEETPHEPNEIYKDEWGVTYQKNGWPIIAQIDTPV